MTVDLHIDELVWHGFPASQGANLGDSIQRRLARLLAEPDARNVADPDGIAVVSSDAEVEAVGAVLSGEIFRRMKDAPVHGDDDGNAE